MIRQSRPVGGVGRVGVPLLVAMCCVGISACGSHASSSAPISSGSSHAAASPAATPAIDACSLIPADEITSLLGSPAPGVSTEKDPRRGSCSWTNAATDESVSLNVGSPDTARGDVLPPAADGFDPTTPGPDGMRYLGNGSVEFAAGGRVNDVQVAVLRLLGDQANAAAVKLAREVGPQIPQ